LCSAKRGGASGAFSQSTPTEQSSVASLTRQTCTRPSLHAAQHTTHTTHLPSYIHRRFPREFSYSLQASISTVFGALGSINGSLTIINSDIQIHFRRNKTASSVRHLLVHANRAVSSRSICKTIGFVEAPITYVFDIL